MRVCCRPDAGTSRQPSSCSAVSDINCRQTSPQSPSSALVPRSSPCSPGAARTSLVDAWHAQSSTAGARQAPPPSLTGALLRGVDLSLAAVVLGASSPRQPQPPMRIHVTGTESPERRASPGAAARPASAAVGRRSAGVPHGSLRAFQQQQATARHHNTLLVVPPSSSPRSLVVSVRGGSVSTSPSSASPSPSPEPPASRAAAAASQRSLSTQRPLGVTRHGDKLARTCVPQRHCSDQRPQLSVAGGGQASAPARAADTEQETFV